MATKNTTPATTTPAAAAPGKCLCGCGLGVAPRRSWLPGHDARAAGVAARALQAGDATRRDALPTPALQAKATALAERWTATAAAKAERAAERAAAKEAAAA